MSELIFQPRTKLNWRNQLQELINNVRDNKWTEVIARIQSHPQEVCVQGLNGQTALHLSCCRYPPTPVIRAILNAAPGITAFPNEDGETSLHLALGSASEEVQLLLIQDSVEAIFKTDNHGDTPLHLAVISGASRRVLLTLIRLNPLAILQPNHNSRTPFDNLRRSYQYAEIMEDIICNTTEDSGEFFFRDDWNKALLFLLSAASFIYGFQLPSNYPLEASNNSNKINNDCLARIELVNSISPFHSSYHCVPLHIATWINCPRSVTKTLSTWYPDQCLAVDSFGNTPLCLAASAPLWNYTGDFVDELDDPEDDDDDEQPKDESVIQILLSANLSAASIPNAKTGRLPLALALEAGKSLDTEVFPILQAYPQAIEVRDTATHLYPFMMAAVAATLDNNDDESTLTTVFQLLLMQPQLVSTNPYTTSSKRCISFATSAGRNSRRKY